MTPTSTAPARAALVKRKTEECLHARTHWEHAFKRMREDMEDIDR
jgi:hypothetical protein